jgi:hypothetical protein
LADFCGKGHVAFPVTLALSGSRLIGETQKLKLYGFMVPFSAVVFAVGNVRLALIDLQLYFRQPVDQRYLDLLSLLLGQTVDHHIICKSHNIEIPVRLFIKVCPALLVNPNCLASFS